MTDGAAKKRHAVHAALFKTNGTFIEVGHIIKLPTDYPDYHAHLKLESVYPNRIVKIISARRL